MGREGASSRITKQKHAENPSTARDSRTPPEPKSSIDSESESDSDRERRRRRKSSKRKTSRRDDSDSELESGSDSGRDRRRKRKKKSRSRKSSRRRYTDSESESSESDSESESDGDRKSRKKRKSSRRRYSDSESESESDRRRRKRREKDRKKRKIGGDDDGERRGKRKKKEKDKKKKKKGKIGAVTNTWGKYGIVRENDMWNKRPEFSAWLSEIKQVNLESLPTRDEKIMFKEYMEDYNTATFPSKKYYDLDAYHRRKLEKQMKQGFKKASNTERLVFNDEEQRRQEIQQAREKEKEKEVIAKMEYMKSGMAEDMKEQRRLQEEMAYLFKIGNVEAATAIQRKLEPDVPM